MAQGSVTKQFSVLLQSTSDLQFSIAQLTEAGEITKFLLQNFFPELPTIQLQKINVNEEIEPWLINFVTSVVQKNISIVVRDIQTSKIIAVRINDILHHNDKKPLLFSFADEKFPKMYKNLQLLKDLFMGVDLLEGTGEMCLLFMTMMGVNRHYIQRGLGFKLIQLTESIAKEKNLRILVSESVSEFAAKAFFKAGFVVEKEIMFNDYTIDGELVFANDGVHQKARLFVKFI